MIFKIEKGGSEILHVGMNKSNLILPKNAKHRSFQKGPTKKIIYEISNDDMYAQIEYKENGDIFGVTVVPPSVVSFKIFNNLFDTSVFDIYKFLKNDDDKVYVDGDGITSNKYHFNLYMPNLTDLEKNEEDEDTFKIEAVLMFKVGYYDELLKSYPSALHDDRLAKLLDQAAGL